MSPIGLIWVQKHVKYYSYAQGVLNTDVSSSSVIRRALFKIVYVIYDDALYVSGLGLSVNDDERLLGACDDVILA